MALATLLGDSLSGSAVAALVKDLKRLGMLEDTLVVWGGEFGRTPMVESSAALGRSLGRDHHPQAFTMWLAGGGIKKGFLIGETDELGFHITDLPFHVHDLQATILHLFRHIQPDDRCRQLSHYTWTSPSAECSNASLYRRNSTSGRQASARSRQRRPASA